MLKNKPGFAIIELIVAIVVIVAIAGLVFFAINKGKNKDKNEVQNNQRQTVNKTETPLVIHNFGVASLDSIDINSQAISNYSKNGQKGFYPFGDTLPGTPVRRNPNFEFASVKEGTQLISAIDGMVGIVRKQEETNDYEIFLMTGENSSWVISYDHITDLKVEKGSRVKIGDVLGTPSRQKNGLLRYEFQVNKSDGSQDGIIVCPSTLLAADVRDQQLQQLKKMEEAWEAASGLDLYNIAQQNPVGCLKTDMTAAYSNGQ